ncbi:MAG: hypothetical protein Q9226_008596 [Calogaya cf. arnoldii]
MPEEGGKSSAHATTKDLPSHLDTEAPEEGYADVDVGENRPGYAESDRRDMYRMGKRQELMVEKHPIMPAGLFWSYIWTFLGSGVIVLSLAEMASMFVSLNYHNQTWF